MAESIKEVYKSLYKNVRSTTFRLCKHSSYFVINICDVHTVEDVIFEIILQYSPEYVKRYVGSERTRILMKYRELIHQKCCMGLGWKTFLSQYLYLHQTIFKHNSSKCFVIWFTASHAQTNKSLAQIECLNVCFSLFIDRCSVSIGPF